MTGLCVIQIQLRVIDNRLCVILIGVSRLVSDNNIRHNGGRVLIILCVIRGAGGYRRRERQLVSHFCRHVVERGGSRGEATASPAEQGR